MKSKSLEFRSIRAGIASIPGDVSADAVGAYEARLEEIYAPQTHAAALDPTTPIVVGPRGTGKSFWSSVLGREETRAAASIAYPRLGLGNVVTYFGFTGVGGLQGITAESLDELVPQDAEIGGAKAFWWATILRAIETYDNGGELRPLSDLVPLAVDRAGREKRIAEIDSRLGNSKKVLLIVYDALDTVARTWPRRRLLTEALFEVVWGMRAFRSVRMKLFLRPDQVDDDALRFVELPKLRTGAVRLAWSGTDLYGLLFSRLALANEAVVQESFRKITTHVGAGVADRSKILAGEWSLSHNTELQTKVVEILAGPYMATGTYGYKKGKTYDWPLTHLADAFDEVTPRSFLGLMIAAAKFGEPPQDRAITPDGIRHGLRDASRTRVDQLHQEFHWIKGVLAPLAGLLLPTRQEDVFAAWKKTNTIQTLLRDAMKSNYMPPFPDKSGSESALLVALQKIGVMFRRKDERIDMPDLFRVAAKLLKKGAPAPT